MKCNILIIELYHSLKENQSISSFLSNKGYQVSIYSLFKQEKQRFISKKSYVLREAVCFIKLLFHFLQLRNKINYCLGGYYSILLIYKLLGLFLGANFKLFIYNFYIHQAGEKPIIQYILRFLLRNKHCILIVQSPAEVDYYAKLTSIPIHFVPYCAPERKLAAQRTVLLPDKEYIFTGGYTNRDYGSVIACAIKMPDTLFVVVISSLNVELRGQKIPPNVIIYKDIDRDKFEYLLANSTIVLVPLMKNVGSSGQMLCLSAMQFKKAIVYSNVSVISYYLDNDAGIPYRIGDPDSMEKSLKTMLLYPKLREMKGTNAFKNYIDYYTPEHQFSQLYNIIEQYVG